MVDSFARLQPEAQGRYTCWCQYTNSRYIDNTGARIDYCLVDSAFWDAHAVKPNPVGLYTPSTCQRQMTAGAASVNTQRSEGSVDPNSFLAAKAAATAGQRWRPAAFDGTGIPNASQEVYESQFRPAHTGMIYTPPSYSDHIAVSLLIRNIAPLSDIKLSKACSDKRSRASQPFKRQQRLENFFRVKRPRQV